MIKLINVRLFKTYNSWRKSDEICGADANFEIS